MLRVHMIDLVDLRTRPKAYQDAAQKKGLDIDIAGFLTLDTLRRELLALVEEMRAKRNSVSKRVPAMKGKEKEEALREMKTLAEKLKEKEEALKRTEDAWEAMQLLLPAIPLARVPVGKDSADNREVKRWGDPASVLRVAPGSVKDHVTLGEALGIIDLPRGVKIAGTRGYVLKGDGARLHLAVLRLAIDLLLRKSWTLFCPPLLAGWDCFMGTGFFPGSEQQNIYAVGGQEEKGGPLKGDGLSLIGTSEVSVCSYHKNAVLSAAELPKRY